MNGLRRLLNKNVMDCLKKKWLLQQMLDDNHDDDEGLKYVGRFLMVSLAVDVTIRLVFFKTTKQFFEEPETTK